MASDHAGTGGGLPYLSETPEPEMFCQELPRSCQVACARQLLREAGAKISESELREKIGYSLRIGTVPYDTAVALDALHPLLGYNAGIVDDVDVVRTLFKRDPWIASLLTDFGDLHAVIVDGERDGILRLRDPWGENGPGSGCGTRATMSLDDFMTRRRGSDAGAVFPSRRK